MWKWLDENPEARLSLPSRVQSLKPYVSAGITFGLTTSALRHSEGNGDLGLAPQKAAVDATHQ